LTEYIEHARGEVDTNILLNFNWKGETILHCNTFMCSGVIIKQHDAVLRTNDNDQSTAVIKICVFL